MTGGLETFTAGRPLRVDTAAIERALRDLWKEAAEGGSGDARPVTRACLLNLVVWSSPSAAERIPGIVARVVETHPCRVLMVEVDPASDADDLEAFISAWCHRPAPGARQVCCEQITLRAGAGAAGHLPGLAAALTAPDLPILVWAAEPASLADPLFRRLAAGADRVLVDSAETGAAGLRDLAALAADHPRVAAGDMNWHRLRPIQDLVAGFFDPPHFRPAIPHLASVETRGGPGSEAGGALLAGWIGTVAGRAISARHRTDDTAPGLVLSAVRLAAAGGALPATFVVESESPGALTARVEFTGTCPLPRRVSVRVPETAALLGAELGRSGRDPLFESSLARAAALAP